MKSAFWRSIAVVALVAVPMMANANDATIGSEVSNNAMRGATLMNTTAVFNVFPHMVVDHGNGVELDADDGSGSGRIWWEAHDGWWTNMTVGRSDLGLQGTNFMWGGDTFSPEFTTRAFGNKPGFGGSGFFDVGETPPFEDSMWLSFGLARATSGGGAWAANIQLAPFTSESTKDNTGVDTETNRTGYGAQVSWGNGNGLHISAEFGAQTWEAKDNQASTKNDLTVTDFGVAARWDRAKYIYQGSFYYLDGSTSDSDAAIMDTSDSGTGVLLTAGRYIKNEVDGQATAEFGLSWENGTYDNGANPKDELSSTDFGFPLVRIAAWEMISNRWGLMGAVRWGYTFESETDDLPANEETSDNGSGYDWSAGLFFQPSETVRIDARLEESNLNSVLNLGNTNDLIVYIGATVGLN